MAEEQQDFMTVDLGADNGGIVSFDSIQEVEAWCNQESSAWFWLEDVKHKKEGDMGVINGQQRIQQGITDAIKAYKIAPNEHSIKRIKTGFETTYQTEKKALCSTSPQGQWVLALKDKNAIMGAYALGYFIRCVALPRATSYQHASQKALSQHWALKGYLAAYCYDHNLDDKKVDVVNAALDALSHDFTKQLDHSRKETENLRATLMGERELLEEQAKANQVEHDDLIAKQKAEFEAALEKTKEDFKAFEDTYNENVRLSKPRKYWSDKAEEYGESVKKYFKWTLGWGVLGALTIIGCISHFFAVDTILQIHLWHIPALLIAVTIYIWIERIFVRLLLSNAHLKTDAGERVVMVETFLALLQDNKETTKQEREIILTSLFRPNSTGIISNDGLPLADILQALKLTR
tara:strand:+ start:27427 stop:28644 length:1218 start_codon:yes stop_codon:yes gene_type:complete